MLMKCVLKIIMRMFVSVLNQFWYCKNSELMVEVVNLRNKNIVESFIIKKSVGISVVFLVLFFDKFVIEILFIQVRQGGIMGSIQGLRKDMMLVKSVMIMVGSRVVFMILILNIVLIQVILM